MGTITDPRRLLTGRRYSYCRGPFPIKIGETWFLFNGRNNVWYQNRWHPCSDPFNKFGKPQSVTVYQ